MEKLIWEHIDSDMKEGSSKLLTAPLCKRTKIIGGWLVFVRGDGHSGGLTFIPDPNYQWK